MHLESHATPANNASPQQRYAALHRALERGLVSDAVWKELAEVSFALGHSEEAEHCATQIGNDAMRLALESKLQRSRRAKNDHPVAAPAASNAGPAEQAPHRSAANRILAEAEEEAGLRGHLVDAVQFLLYQHMPWLCLLTMLSFPVVIGLGGFLTSGTSAVALAAISALPGICVMAVICAMGRRILIESSHGVVDAPAVPELKLLVMEALRFARDLTIVATFLLVPAVIAMALNLSPIGLAPFIMVGMTVAPMAFCLRQLRGDKASLSPILVGKAVLKGGSTYMAVTAVCWTMLIPLAATLWYVGGQPVWLQIAAVGPTAVLPVFLATRLLGTWIDANEDTMGELFHIAETDHAAPDAKERDCAPAEVANTDQPAPKPKPKGRIAKAPRNLPAARRQAAPSPRASAPATRSPAAKSPEARAPGRTPASRQARPQPNAPQTGRPAAVRRRAAPAPAPARTPTPSERIEESHSRAIRAIEGRQPQPPQVTDVPDLSQIPGAVVVSGRERNHSGAAARR